MAIALEFIDFIIPVGLIRAKYPGGWEQCLLDHSSLIGGRVWYDEHLFRDGAMSPAGVRDLVNEWTELGFEPMANVEGRHVWQDCCVTERMFGGPTLPCSWIEMTDDGSAAFLKGTEPGKIVGRAAD